MNGINYLLIVYTLVENRQLFIRAGYLKSSTAGLSISQRLPCLLSSKVLIGWQSIL